MLKVTTTAKEKLKETLQSLAVNSEMSFRITTSPSKPDELELILDRERKGDQVVESEGDTKILLVGSNVAPRLEGVVINYHGKTPRDAGFTISKPTPST